MVDCSIDCGRTIRLIEGILCLGKLRIRVGDSLLVSSDCVIEAVCFLGKSDSIGETLIIVGDSCLGGIGEAHRRVEVLELILYSSKERRILEISGRLRNLREDVGHLAVLLGLLLEVCLLCTQLLGLGSKVLSFLLEVLCLLLSRIGSCLLGCKLCIIAIGLVLCSISVDCVKYFV